MNDKEQNRLKRLQEEYGHTVMLLKSPRLSAETRRVLDALRADLAQQIAAMESTIERHWPEI